jgi:hypothetical protein
MVSLRFELIVFCSGYFLISIRQPWSSVQVPMELVLLVQRDQVDVIFLQIQPA